MNKFLLEKTKLQVLKKFKAVKAIPQIAIITGSGIKIFKNQKPLLEIKYDELPIWSKKKQRDKEAEKQKIKGHEGILKLYKVQNKDILLFSGRHHLYQGYEIIDVVANIRLCYELGVKNLIVTNAAGSLNLKEKKILRVSDLMLITAFIDLMQSTERGTLSGIIQPPSKIKTGLNRLILKKLHPYIRAGTYAGTLGPSYETYSEIKLLQSLKAHAVGMSTIPEIIAAKSLGINYAAISIISNIWNKNHKPSHIEVLKNVSKANERLNNLILKLLDHINNQVK